MTAKRKYKTLSTAQAAKVKRYTKEGKSQGVIARALGVSKQRVANAQRKAGVGKRAASPFWKQVKKVKEAAGISHKEATRVVYHAPKWGKKRHGADYLPPEERSAAMKAKRAEFMQGKLNKDDQKELEDYGADIGLGDTPK
jgi:4-hydroxy-3-methylbut-2-enyl diphosphate reductase IspH